MLVLALLLAAAVPPQQQEGDGRRGQWRGRGPAAGPERGGPRRGGPDFAPRRGGPGYSLRQVAPAAPPPAFIPPQRRGDQWHAFEQRREGALPLREIENRVVPTMRGAEYIGFDYDPRGGIYTLKFLRNGTVIWVEVDGRSGQVLGRTRG